MAEDRSKAPKARNVAPSPTGWVGGNKTTER